MIPFKINSDENTIEAQSMRSDTHGMRQLFLEPAGSGLSFGVTTHDGEWTVLTEEDVPPGLAENLSMQLVAYDLSTGEGETGDAAAFTYDGMLISKNSGFLLQPADVMAALRFRQNTPGAAEWIFRVVLGTEPDPVTGWRKIRIEVKGETGKDIAWGLCVLVALGQRP